MATQLSFADLSPYRARVEAAFRQPQGLDALIGAFQQGAQQGSDLANLPQDLQNQQLLKQIAIATQQAQLQKLQRPQGYEVNGSLIMQDPVTGQFKPVFTSAPKVEAYNIPGVGLVGTDPTSTTGYKVLIPAVQDPSKGFIETSAGMLKPNPTTGELENKFPFTQKVTPPKTKLIDTFDMNSGTYGVHELAPGDSLPSGIVPKEQILPSTGDSGIQGKLKGDIKKSGKSLSTQQVDQLSGLDLLLNKIDVLEKTPSKIVASNVGWLDNILGYIQGATGLGSSSTIAQNETFRNAVDTLIGEYSFGRGGKSLTVNEKEILGKYIPSLTNSDVQFPSRVQSFKSLVSELKNSKIQNLEDSGYDTGSLKKSNQSEEVSSPVATPGINPNAPSPIKIGRFTLIPE